MEDNLYVEGEIGVSVGGNPRARRAFATWYSATTCWWTSAAAGPPTAPGLGHRSDRLAGGEVTGNLVIHNRSGITNAYALKTDSGTR